MGPVSEVATRMLAVVGDGDDLTMPDPSGDSTQPA